MKPRLGAASSNKPGSYFSADPLRRSRLIHICAVTLEQARELRWSSTVFQTPPLLAIEVVSPDSIQRDYRHKCSEYAAIGIPEYWIVDPIETYLTLFTLNEGFYDEIVFSTTQTL